MVNVPLRVGETRIPAFGGMDATYVMLDAPWLGAFAQLRRVSKAAFKRYERGLVCGPFHVPGVPAVWAQWGGSIHVWPAPDRDYRLSVSFR